ncbi:LapA family protein [Noviherbaspirillum cavernae]|uniref:LapA family protein n=1 Tax=Noviherbaspirillum cavernae TaxID=2320862 RepID=A0A418X613_9BURK|nr:LapA family protein [Noviherbaspirillum cavernae]RJG07885.1 LapA family protein [Noviherbaspirillum cavernae]
MRWLHTIVMTAFVAVVLIFALQNLQTVTVSFLNFRISVPLAILVAIIYLLGMATGSSAWALVRWAWHESKQRKQQTM